jgi:hypothetical protein
VTIDLSGIIQSHAAFRDSQPGMCGFPLYEMSDVDLSVISDHRDLDLVREALRQHGVYQFFYTSPDQLLLGTIERGATPSPFGRPDGLADRMGHPPGRMELIPR